MNLFYQALTDFQFSTAIFLNHFRIRKSEIFGEDIVRSFIIIIKRIGPNFVPCGSPAVTGSHCETVDSNFMITAFHRHVRKLEIHGILDRLTFMLISFSITMLWLILSNALLKSRKHTLR